MDYEQLPPFKNPPENARVRGLLCTDQKGQVQVVAPESALIDPEPIVAVTARELRSIPVSLQQPVCAIPGFYGVPTVIHTDLKGMPKLALATENPGIYVEATGKQIDELCNSHASFEADLCAPLTPTPIKTNDDEQDILTAVDRFTVRRIEARLDETLHIPPLPEAARRILALQRNPDFELSELVQIIETDPAIAARIMGWANSALYAAPSPVKTLHDAIMRVLGVDVVFNMAIGLAIGSTLNLPKSDVSGASPYWLDAVYTAATMEALAHQMSGDDTPAPGTCYLIGLLANFGTLVLGHVFPPYYESICRMQEANPLIHHTYIDQHVLAVNREVIAATLFELWDVPEEVSTSVRFQWVPDYAGDHQTYVKMLTIAKNLLSDQPVDYDPIPQTLALGREVVNIAAEIGISEPNLQLVADTVLKAREDLGDLARLMTR
ncbi:MAG: HDOD domain-containing protein [Pseudomonadales bacterium]